MGGEGMGAALPAFWPVPRSPQHEFIGTPRK
jgi:hypothetical protein